MKINPLSLDFLIQKPGTAASVLQNLDAEQAALYLAHDIPIRVLAPVVEKIESWPAARILEFMPLEKSCAILKQLSYPTTAALMRLFDNEQRQLVLQHLPSKLVNTLNRALGYPEDTVGAWMDNSTPHFSRDLTIGECLVLLKKAQQPFELIVVVEDSHHIEGVIHPSTLLIGDERRKLKEIVDPACAPLAAQTSLLMANEAEGWKHYGALPIRDGNDVFVGTINRESLFNALSISKPKRKTAPRDTLLSNLSSAMAVTAASFLTMTTNDILISTQARKENNDSNR